MRRRLNRLYRLSNCAGRGLCAFWVLGWSAFLPAAGFAIEGDGARPQESADARAAVHFRLARIEKRLPGVAGFYEVTFFSELRSRKVKRSKAYVRIGEEAKVLMDRPVDLKELKEGEEVYVLGTPVELEVRAGGRGGGGGRGGIPDPELIRGKDRQIVGTKVLLSGSELEVDPDYRDPRAPQLRWIKGPLVTDGIKGIWVRYEKKPYKVVFERRAPLLKRVEAPRKLLRRGAYVLTDAEATDRKPITVDQGEDEDLPSFEARRVVLVDRRRVVTIYPAIIREPKKDPEKADSEPEGRRRGE